MLKMKLPTDLELLQFIYKKYYHFYKSFSREEKNRETKIFVPISMEEIAEYYHIDIDIIFGRLYYYLDEKYGYQRYDGKIVPFFTREAGADKHCVNFPLLSSVLASLQEQNRKYWMTTVIAFYATLLAALAIIISFMRH